VYFTEAVQGYPFLKRYGNPHTLNHIKSLVDRRTKNHISGIEGFWNDVKHILYHYRGVFRFHFPMYQKEIAYGVNHPTTENLCRWFLTIYLGYV